MVASDHTYCDLRSLELDRLTRSCLRFTIVCRVGIPLSSGKGDFLLCLQRGKACYTPFYSTECMATASGCNMMGYAFRGWANRPTLTPLCWQSKKSSPFLQERGISPICPLLFTLLWVSQHTVKSERAVMPAPTYNG